MGFFIFGIDNVCFRYYNSITKFFGGDPMNWMKFLGEELYEKLKATSSKRKLSIATIVRLALEKYLQE